MYLLYIYSLCCKKKSFTTYPELSFSKFFATNFIFRTCFNEQQLVKVLKLHDVVHLPPSCFWQRLELRCMYANTKCEQLGPSFPKPRPGYEVYNSRVKLHQPRPQAAFQKTNKTMASNSRYDSFFFSFLINRLSMYDNNKQPTNICLSSILQQRKFQMRWDIAQGHCLIRCLYGAREYWNINMRFEMK